MLALVGAAAVTFHVPTLAVSPPTFLASKSACLAPRMQLIEPRILTEENAIAVLDECMEDLGTMFGSNEESQRVGITGMVSFVELDGPMLVVRLSGRFWHQRTRVVERVSSYVLERIPECVDVIIEDVEQLDDSDVDELEKRLGSVYDPVQFGNEGSEGVM